MTSSPVPPSAVTPPHVTLSRVVAGVWRMDDWNMTPQERLGWIERCLDLGVTTFDHADIYGGYTVESLFGEALALNPGLRGQMQLVSKCGIRLPSPERPAHRLKSYGTTADHIIASAERSVRNLRTDHLDVLLIHRPSPLLDADEVAQAFQTLRDRGVVRAFGVSNFTPTQFSLLHSRFPLVTNQIELSPLHLAPLHDGTLDQAQQLRLPPMIWSPLAGGRLLTEQTDRAGQVRQVLERQARERDVSPAAMAFAWILRHPARPLPITGSGRTQAVAEAVAAQEIALDEESWFEIWSAATGHEVP